MTATTSGKAESVPLSSGIQYLQSKDDFDRILTEAGNRYVLVEFFAEWCGPCRLVTTKLELWIKTFDVIIVKVDVDDFEDLAIEYEVSSMPTFVMIKEKQKLQTFEGSNTEKVENYMEKNCARGGTRSSIYGTAPTTKARQAAKRDIVPESTKKSTKS